MMKYLISLGLVFLVGCFETKTPETVSSTEMVTTNEAPTDSKSEEFDASVTHAYDLLDVGHVIEAEKIFKDIIVKAQADKNAFFEGQALTGLAYVYSNDTPATGDEVPEKLLNYKLAAQKYEEAGTKLLAAEYTKLATMAFYGAAEMYKKENEKAKACDLYIKSAKTYDLESKKREDQIGPELEEQVGPILEGYKKQNYKIDCSFKDKKSSGKPAKSSQDKKKK